MTEHYYIFIDESGWADVKTYKQSKYYTMCGLVISEGGRKTLKEELDQLKIKYFHNKSFILHSVKLKRKLKTEERIRAFANDLNKLLRQTPFYLLFVVVDKEKASKVSWINSTVYERCYRSLIGNLVKFLIAKGAIGHIHAEASSTEQDIHLYKSFFHYIAHGLDRLSISSDSVKQHLTTVSFVTKINNDPEEQMADLFGICGKINAQLEKGELKTEEMDPLDIVLYNSMQKRLFNIANAKNPKKVSLYKDINPFVKFP